MLPFLGWVLIALLAAAAVVLLASATGGERREGASFLGDLRAGWSARRNPDAEQRAAAQAADVEPVDVPLEEFLAATVEADDDGYLRTDQVMETLLKARDRAVHGVPRSIPRLRARTRRPDHQDLSGR